MSRERPEPVGKETPRGSQQDFALADGLALSLPPPVASPQRLQDDEHKTDVVDTTAPVMWRYIMPWVPCKTVV